jgi:gluconate 2-dehydrogenase alpha chain
VILCAFGLNNVKLLLSSGIGPPYDPATGQGTVGRHSPYQTMAAVNVFYPERVRINPFMGAAALGTVLDDVNGDNFDHAGLGFVDGGYVAANSTGARPIEYHPGPRHESRQWFDTWQPSQASPSWQRERVPGPSSLFLPGGHADVP